MKSNAMPLYILPNIIALLISFAGFSYACGPGEYSPVHESISGPAKEIRPNQKFHIEMCMEASEPMTTAKIEVHAPKEVVITGRLDLSSKDKGRNKFAPWVFEPQSGGHEISWQGELKPRRLFPWDSWREFLTTVEQCLIVELVSKTDRSKWSGPIRGRMGFLNQNSASYSWEGGYYYSDIEWQPGGDDLYSSRNVATTHDAFGFVDGGFHRPAKKIPLGKKGAHLDDIKVIRALLGAAFIETPDGKVHGITFRDFVGNVEVMYGDTDMYANPDSYTDIVVFKESETDKSYIQVTFKFKGNVQSIERQKVEKKPLTWWPFALIVENNKKGRQLSEKKGRKREHFIK